MVNIVQANTVLFSENFDCQTISVLSLSFHEGILDFYCIGHFVYCTVCVWVGDTKVIRQTLLFGYILDCLCASDISTCVHAFVL